MAITSLFCLLILYNNVFNILAERNVARGKPTNQSSMVQGGNSSRAVDGDTNSVYGEGSCTHTYDVSPTWWCVNLGRSINIETVQIYNRDGNQERLQGFEIKMGSHGSCNETGFQSATSCYTNSTTPPQEVYSIKQCNQNTTSFAGRFVFIGITNDIEGDTEKIALTLCEVKIFEECNALCKDGKCNQDGVCIGCNNGSYGNQCNQACVSTCNTICQQSDGRCTSGCVDGYWGSYCNESCSTQCNGGCIQSNGVCNGCIIGRYADYCNKTCSNGCLEELCSRQDGNCSCTDRFYGSRCTLPCSNTCKQSRCTETSSQPQCSSGCVDGYKGLYCQTSCPTNCLICDTSSCSVCKTGWYGTNCQTSCPTNCLICDTSSCSVCNTGWYGTNCQTSCPTNCLICDTSSCSVCNTGLYGTNCQISCPTNCLRCNATSCSVCNTGWYGTNCQRECSINCVDGCQTLDDNCKSTRQTASPLCNITGGFCTLGCKDSFYGENCIKRCSPFCQDNLCGQMSGVCANGCIAGKSGINCMEDISESESNTTVIISVVMVMLVILVVVIIVGIIFIKRRRINSRKNDLINPISSLNPAYDGESQPTEVAAEMNYANLQDHEGLVYQNLSEQQRSLTCIDLINLWDYIERKKEQAEFSDEYQKLPKGLCEAHDVALNEVNRPKNRYRSICAFDHTRVKLEVEDDDPNSDYINACYITMYDDSEKKYIASQGPNKVNINEFIRMIWDVDASKIVMVTNFIEMGVEKSMNYLSWPDISKSEKCGKISIKIISEDIFAHFTIRQLKITKDGCDSRTLTQYHYTCWPDKGVPADKASLVEFRNKVRKSTLMHTGPMIVHCSAGIGRTGTFLALDYLIEEGKAKTSVDVFRCLSQMRHERVNMIQTLEQYVFLHETLVEWYLSEDTTADVTAYQQVYQTLMAVNNQTGKSGLHEKYEMMNKVCTGREDGDYSAALLPQNKSKNRDLNILASNTARLYLQLTDSNSTDYINAVNLPSYKKKNGYILTQTPLPNTVTDFWILVIQSETNIIIDLGGDESNRKDIGEYIPSKAVVRCNSYGITKTNEKEHQSGLFNIITCNITSESEEDFDRKVRIYQCNFWTGKQKTPRSANHIFSLLEEINSSSNKNISTPVVVHCMNGVDRGGLFCVMGAILERLTIEQVVSVIQIIMQLRVQRPQIITCYEQFKFCFDAVGEYLDNFSTYANSC